MNADMSKERLSNIDVALSVSTLATEFVAARVLAGATGAVYSLYASFCTGYSSGWRAHFLAEQTQPLLHLPWPHDINVLRILIALAFLTSFFGLGARTAKGFLVSAASVFAVVPCFVWWSRISSATLESLGVSDFSQANFGRPFTYAGGLKDAIWLDIVLLVMAGGLLIWKAFVFIRVLKRSYS
jgi:hypothetical protein